LQTDCIQNFGFEFLRNDFANIFFTADQKHEVISVVQSWNLSPLMRTMLKHARNKFWLSYLPCKD
jgi:hypothetical protein